MQVFRDPSVISSPSSLSVLHQFYCLPFPFCAFRSLGLGDGVAEGVPSTKYDPTNNTSFGNTNNSYNTCLSFPCSSFSFILSQYLISVISLLFLITCSFSLCISLLSPLHMCTCVPHNTHTVYMYVYASKLSISSKVSLAVVLHDCVTSVLSI